jgi:hypothetical protein
MLTVLDSYWSVAAAVGWGAAGFLACILLLRTQRNAPAVNQDERTHAHTKTNQPKSMLAMPSGKQRSLSSAPCCLNCNSDCSCPVLPHSQDMEKLLRQNR